MGLQSSIDLGYCTRNVKCVNTAIKLQRTKIDERNTTTAMGNCRNGNASCKWKRIHRNMWQLLRFLHIKKPENVLKELFATHGIPRVLELDNGIQYSAKEFKCFSTKWKFVVKHQVRNFLVQMAWPEIMLESQNQ